MATSIQITNWISANAERLSLKVQEIVVPFDWVPWLFDFNVSISINGTTFTGRGTGNDENTALIKACVEAFERYLTRVNGFPNTSGVAGHLSVTLAVDHAVNELIERDAFFCHHLTKTPFLELNADAYDFSSDAKFALKEFGVDLKFGVLRSTTHRNAAICVAFGDRFQTPFGVTVGLGCHHDLEISLNQAVKECLTNVVPLLSNNETTQLTKLQFDEIEKPRPCHHFALGLNPHSAKDLFSMFTYNPPRNQPVTISPTVSYEELDTKGTFLNGLPIKFVRAMSMDLQTAYFGKLDPSKVNLPRLSKFATSRLSFEQLNRQPHLFG